ncbi:MAG: selenocysteine-specific translation elongation factor [Candidatus Accumulibacter sp.]|jgi:selenocysteine-specific elongation factor|nr:selenocysteine-specific translation elongation factor [Accumulibacter sp.]
MIVGTAGHIDHGKTSLIKALTGIDCDRLKEEKARGITLDLGYAFRRLPPGGKDAPVLGFIDVPGHEKLVRNMLAGATGIDFVLLAVAADDGPMPQTREHLQIAELLGIVRGAVALTKIGLVDARRRAAAIGEARALLAGTALADIPIFPVDALSGDGVDALRAHLENAAGEPGGRAAEGRFRLAVDRVFSLAGTGTVVTGTAFSGSVGVGAQLALSPGGRPVRVRGLRAQGEPAERGGAGQRVALALSGVEKSEAARGMWLLEAGIDHPLRCFTAELRVLPGQAPLKHWTPVHCHLGADDIPARLALLEAETLFPGESGFAEIALERETSVLAGDRFILRDAAARATVGGGRVVDIFPPARRKRAPERLELLRALSAGGVAGALALMADRSAAGVDLARLALGHNLGARALDELCAARRLRVVAGAAFSPERWAALGERIVAMLSDEHARQPDMPGVERDRLRRLTLPALARPPFDALLAELLAASRIAQTGAWLHLPGHRVQLTARDRELWERLKPELLAAPFNPPRVRDLARDHGLTEETVRAVMKGAARIGEAYPVAHDHYFYAGAVAELAARVAALAGEDGAVRAARLRDAIGGGRKVAIHILEFFDRVGYTRRVRDAHALRSVPLSGSPLFRNGP